VGASGGFVFKNRDGNRRLLRDIQRASAIPLVHVRDFARHSDLAITNGYVHKTDSPQITAAIAEALGGTDSD
jgi:hypothetical protein